MKTEFIDIGDLKATIHSPSPDVGHYLYIHGGPGLHGRYFAEFLKNNPFYQNAPFGFIIYDQRGCGLSSDHGDVVYHQINKNDLVKVVEDIKSKGLANLLGIIGHSYGANLLSELVLEGKFLDTPIVLVGKSEELNLPLKRSVLIDATLLKIHFPEKYQNLYPKIVSSEGKLWKVADKIKESLGPERSKLRLPYYWGNLKACQIYNGIVQTSKYQENKFVFQNVMKSLVGQKSQLPKKSTLDDLKHTKAIWIHGLHDFLMAGEEMKPDCKGKIIFSDSGHYPHIENPEKFIRTLEFLTSLT